MRQMNNKFTQQEHQSLIDWVIALLANITISEHQIELKMYGHNFKSFPGRA
jgi:hypothetical protein